MEANCSEKGPPPKKIMIFGIPGSGKSTFALKISRLLNVSLFHLDKYFLLADGKRETIRSFYKFKKDWWIRTLG